MRPPGQSGLCAPGPCGPCGCPFLPRVHWVCDSRRWWRGLSSTTWPCLECGGRHFQQDSPGLGGPEALVLRASWGKGRARLSGYRPAAVTKTTGTYRHTSVHLSVCYFHLTQRMERGKLTATVDVLAAKQLPPVPWGPDCMFRAGFSLRSSQVQSSLE